MPCAPTSTLSVLLIVIAQPALSPQRIQDHQQRAGWDAARTLRFFCFGVGISMYSAFSSEVNLEPPASEAPYWAGGTSFSSASSLCAGGAPIESASKLYQRDLLQIKSWCEFASIHSLYATISPLHFFRAPVGVCSRFFAHVGLSSDHFHTACDIYRFHWYHGGSNQESNTGQIY